MANNRLICERAVYDWSFNDPRTLVYFQQQRLRAILLDKAAAEATCRPWWITCLGSIGQAVRSIVAGGAAGRALPAPSARPRLASPALSGGTTLASAA